MDVETFVQDSAFNSFGYASRSGIVGSYSNCIFNSLRNWPKKKNLLSKEPEPFYIPINSAQWFQFLHILANTCHFLFSSYSLIFSCLIFIIYFFPVALGLARSFSSSLSCPSLFSALIDYPMQSRTRYKSPSKAIHWCKPLLWQCSRTVVTAVVFNILISSKNSKINPGGGGLGGQHHRIQPHLLFSALLAVNSLGSKQSPQWGWGGGRPTDARQKRQTNPTGPNGHSRATTPSPEPHPPASNTTQKAGLRTETYVEANQTRFPGGKEQSVCYEKFL